MFGAWGDERPPDFHEINDYIRHINPDEKMPEWIHEVVDILLENKDKAEITDTKYRKFLNGYILNDLRWDTDHPFVLLAPLTYLRYDKLAYVPSNFIAVGDSVMQPNPTFGCVYFYNDLRGDNFVLNFLLDFHCTPFSQGIAKACVCAVTVDSILRSKEMMESTTIPTGFSARFFKVQARRTESAWNGAKAIGNV